MNEPLSTSYKQFINVWHIKAMLVCILYIFDFESRKYYGWVYDDAPNLPEFAHAVCGTLTHVQSPALSAPRQVECGNNLKIQLFACWIIANHFECMLSCCDVWNTVLVFIPSTSGNGYVIYIIWDFPFFWCFWQLYYRRVSTDRLFFFSGIVLTVAFLYFLNVLASMIAWQVWKSYDDVFIFELWAYRTQWTRMGKKICKHVDVSLQRLPNWLRDYIINGRHKDLTRC